MPFLYLIGKDMFD